MTAAGIPGLSVLRSLSRPRTTYGVCSLAHVTLGSHRSTPTLSMLGRANASFQAKPKAQQPQAHMAKQPLSTSSQGSTHDANIKEQFQKYNGPSAGLSKFSQPSKPARPFQPRSSNISQPLNPPQPANRTVNSNSFASLYRKENSFEEGPDLTGPTAGGVDVSNRVAIGEGFYEDELSDDYELALELERPAALPPPPPPPVQVTPSKQDVDATPADNISNMSWSQSSPSHFLAAQSVSYSTSSRGSTKRSSPDDDTQAAEPVAKRRTLPKTGYPSLTHCEDDVDSASAHNVANPAAKPQAKTKQSRVWDYGPDTIKTQQKLLKGKSKKSAVSGAEASVEDMQHAVKSYTVKQSAISLSNEQEHVKELVCNMGKSVFFTGPAGTGKSVLMRAIVQEMKKKYAKDPERLAVTASTGLAACNVGGMTLHSFAGIGLGKDDAQTLVKKIRRNPKAKNRWIKTRVLIIDEISMVDGDLFDKLSQIGRIIRNNGRPWGGIQLVITGDFFQLPPVPDRDSRDSKFAFEAATWNTSIDHTIGLTEVFRQKDPGKPRMESHSMLLANISSLCLDAERDASRSY